MPDHTWERLKEIFEAALEYAAPERGAFLEKACGGNDALRAEVEALLIAGADAGDFLKATKNATPKGPDPTEKPGTVIGRYKLLQQIGEGGFGSVYMAEQERPVRRKVALKVIKLGMDTKQVIARFEAERQALALMDHPNIARVLDAGSTENGRPYFVMELVRGVPITEYCDTNSLSMDARLDLFQSVCGAVQHAHQKGIIHRDIKPTNVMVTLHDGIPVPKVIDFGIAKATNQRLTEKTLFTEYHQFIGTPQYMSPEQAEMSGLDVDTRADIYSLGVLLYELLTGTTPFDPVRLRSMAFSEIHRVIREEDPHKPSTRISTLGVAAADTAKHRRTDLRALRRALSGDLDWIVMKAIEKDRTRRYDTANAMLMDIRRHMRNEPVVAGPPGAAYRIGKFLRRNRTAVSVSGVIVLALLAGLGAASYGFWQANRERAVARTAAQSAESVNAFFDDMLASINPRQLHLHSPFGGAKLAADVSAQFSRDVSVVEMLRGAARRVGNSFEGQPELEASMRETIATTFLGLDECEDALTQFEHARDLRRELLGDQHRDVLRTQVQVANTLYAAERNVEANDIARAVLGGLERIYGPEDPLAMYMASLWGKMLADQGEMTTADSLFELTLARQRRVLGSEHRDTILTLCNWAGAYCWRNNGERAQELAGEAYRRALEAYSPNDAIVLTAESHLGLASAFLGQHEKAKEIMAPSLEKHRRVFGVDHTITRRAAFALARASRQPDEFENEIELYRVAGAGRPAEWVFHRDLGRTLAEHGRVDEAIEVLRAQYDFWRDPKGEGSKKLWGDRLESVRIGSMGWYSHVLSFAGRWKELRPIARERIARERAAAELDSSVNQDWNALGWTLLVIEPVELRDPGEALVWAEKAAATLDGESDAQAGLVYDTKAKAHELLGDLRAACVSQRLAVDALLRAGADGERDAAMALARLVRYELELAASADTVVQGHLGAIADRHLDDDPAHARALRFLGQQLSDLGLYDAAGEPLRLAVQMARQAGDDRGLLECVIERAHHLARTGRRAEAEPLLDEAMALYQTCWVKEPIDWRPGLGRLPGSDGERSRNGADVKSSLAAAALAAGRVEVAEELYDQSLAVLGSGWGSLTPRILEAKGNLAAAEPYWRRVLERSWATNLVEDQPWRLAREESDYAHCLMNLGRWDEAKPLLRHARRILREWGGPTSADLGIAEERLRRLDSRRASLATD